MAECETVQVANAMSKTGYSVINKADFDKAKHKHFDTAKTKKTPPGRAPVAAAAATATAMIGKARVGKARAAAARMAAARAAKAGK